jgi:hypothetical protein
LTLNSNLGKILPSVIVIKKSGSKNVVIILGAGSTYDNADATNEYEKPPLDRKFFQKTGDFLKNRKSIP